MPVTPAPSRGVDRHAGRLRHALPARGAGERPRSDPAKTLSPFFVVDAAEPGIDALPLKATRVDVKVTGVIADVRVAAGLPQ